MSDIFNRHKDPIGGFARGMNISQEGLRYYEQQGIITPERDKESGYRLFGFKETVPIFFCRKYTRYGLGLKQSAELLHTADSNSTHAALLRQQSILAAEIAEKQQTLYSLKRRTKYLAQAAERLGRCFHAESPALDWIPTRIDRKTLKTLEANDRMAQWNEQVLHTGIITVVSAQWLLTGRGRTCVGLGIDTEMAGKLTLEGAHRLPARACVSTVCWAPWNEVLNSDLLFPLLSYMETNQLVPTGDALVSLLDSFLDEEDNTNCLCQLWVPID